MAQALVAASEAVALAAGHPDLYIQAATTARDLGSPLGGWLSQARAGSRADVPAMCMGSSPRPVLGHHWSHRCGVAPRSRISITIRQQAGRVPAFNRRGASHFIIDRAWRLPMQVCRLAAPTPCMLRPDVHGRRGDVQAGGLRAVDAARAGPAALGHGGQERGADAQAPLPAGREARVSLPACGGQRCSCGRRGALWCCATQVRGRCWQGVSQGSRGCTLSREACTTVPRNCSFS